MSEEIKLNEETITKEKLEEIKKTLSNNQKIVEVSEKNYRILERFQE